MDIIKEIEQLLEQRPAVLASISAVGVSQYSARQILCDAVNRLREYEKAFADTERIPKAAERIARAVEAAAMYGWGSVTAEQLGD